MKHDLVIQLIKTLLLNLDYLINLKWQISLLEFRRKFAAEYVKMFFDFL